MTGTDQPSIDLCENQPSFAPPEHGSNIGLIAGENLCEINWGITRADADKRFFPEFDSSENHDLNDRRRYSLSLQIVRLADRYGPMAKLGDETIDSHGRAWDAFWIRYFRDRANEGTDIEVAHPSSYNRFKSEGTRVFISNGALWDNHVEDPAGWFFTRAGDAYVAIRPAGGGYTITNKTYIWPDRKLQEAEASSPTSPKQRKTSRFGSRAFICQKSTAAP